MTSLNALRCHHAGRLRAGAPAFSGTTIPRPSNSSIRVAARHVAARPQQAAALGWHDATRTSSTSSSSSSNSLLGSTRNSTNSTRLPGNSSSSSKIAALSKQRGASTVAFAAAKNKAEGPKIDTVKDFDGRYGNGSTTLIPKEVLEALLPEERSTVTLFQSTSPSVVNISTSTRVGFFPLNMMQIPRGVGSGFIWDKEGHIVTNAHVISGSTQVKVTLSDQSVYNATIVGKDREKDLAVLKLDMPRAQAAQLTPVVVGYSSNLLVGQKVFAIGNPFGLDQTLTSGLVSGLGRELPSNSLTGVPISNVIQTDAAINPGNSGGVLLDSKGQVVGINTAILDPSGNGIFSGVGFAIPIDSAKGLVTQLLQYGRVMRPFLGVRLGPPSVTSRLGVKGVMVLDVAPSGPAARAGVVPTTRNMFGAITWGDIIVSIKGKHVATERDLFVALDECRPGEVVEVGLQQGVGPDAVKRTVKLTLKERGAAVGGE